MQTTNNILLVRPANFGFNEETAASNVFQNEIQELPISIAQNVLLEFEEMVRRLSKRGMNLMVIEDTKDPVKPDAVFPNNWGSFHTNGTVILYPMLAKNRRLEKRPEIINLIAEKFSVSKIIDLSDHEQKSEFLEGTGSIIFDHNCKIAYACLSPRTKKDVFLKTCTILGYSPVYFQAKDTNGKQIYHTNVMLTIGDKFAVVCLESIKDQTDRLQIVQSLEQSNKQIIDISFDQMHAFCANMLELSSTKDQSILAMSQTAFTAFTEDQKRILSEHCELFPINIPTIESIGGGSVRCMITQLFLPTKNI